MAVVVTGDDHRKRVHLAVQFPAGEIDVEALTHVARTAELGLFDFVLLAEGEQPLPVLAALAGATERVGLVGTVDTASRQPFEVARQFATLDHLSDGRAGWNVTAGSHTDADYRRAEEFLAVADALWNSWAPDAVVADAAAGVYARPDRIRAVEHRGEHFDVRGVATLPAGPQGGPVLVHTGASPGGTDFGARHADVVITPHRAAVRARARALGRNPDAVLVLAARGTGGATAERIATDIDRQVQSDVCDGVILVPRAGARGLDEFDALVEQIVPLLQEMGSLHTRSNGVTLRERLAL
jgi:alkanesulfonate monooxygenase SsuD/methylene tetrahydromethanopterin reductase-like flavin-dependent oxidoreductase (luciferase family)